MSLKTISQTLGRRKAAIWFVFTYLSVFMISVIFSFLILLYTRQRIEHDYKQTNDAILSNTQEIVNAIFDTAYHLSFTIGGDRSIEKLFHVQEPLSTQTRLDIAYAISNEMNSRTSQVSINQYLLYFHRGDFFLTGTGRYSPSLAYNTHFSSMEADYDEWITYIGEAHNREILLTGDSIYYVQSIPLQSRTDRYATAFIQISPSTLLRQLNEIEWVQNGHYYIQDNSGNTILSNSSIPIENISITDEQFADINLERTLYSRIEDRNGYTYTLFMDSNEFIESTRSINRFFGIVFIATAAIGIWLTVLFTFRNYTPIRNLLSLFDGSQLLQLKENTNEITFIENSVKKMIQLNTDMKDQVSKKNEMIRQNFLERILSDSVLLSNVTVKQLNENGLTFPFKNFRLAYFSIADFSEYYDGIDILSDDYPVDRLYFTLLEIIKENMSLDMTAYVCESNGMPVVLMNYAENLNEEAIEVNLLKIKEKVYEQLLIPLLVYISRQHKSFYAIQEANRECFFAMQQAKSIQADQKRELFIYQETENGSSFAVTNEMEQVLLNNLISGNAGTVKQLLQEIFQDKQIKYASPHSLFRSYMIHIAVTFIRAIETASIRSENLTAITISDHAAKLLNASEGITYFEQLTDAICIVVNEEKENSHSGLLLSQITDFIDSNITNPNLDNTMIADAVSISPAYLSRVFKQYSGIGISRYISSRRIELAKTLLTDQTTRSVSDVSLAVGIENVATFIRIFKRAEGVTPGQFAAMYRSR